MAAEPWRAGVPCSRVGPGAPLPARRYAARPRLIVRSAVHRRRIDSRAPPAATQRLHPDFERVWFGWSCMIAFRYATFYRIHIQRSDYRSSRIPLNVGWSEVNYSQMRTGFAAEGSDCSTKRRQARVLQHTSQIERILARLDRRRNPNEMNCPASPSPSQGRFGRLLVVTVSGNWRVISALRRPCKRLDLVDYH